MKYTSLLFFFLSTFSQASLIESDLFSAGDLLGYTDTHTNLQWVDLSVTQDKTFGEVQDLLANELIGYRLANHEQVTDLLMNNIVSLMSPFHSQQSEGLVDTFGNPTVLDSSNYFDVYDTTYAYQLSASPSFLEIYNLISTMGGITDFIYGGGNITPAHYIASFQGLFESRYENLGHVTASFSEVREWEWCNITVVGVCDLQTSVDSVNILYWDGATIEFLDTTNGPNNPYKGYFLVKDAISVSEPHHIGFLMAFLYLFALKRQRHKSLWRDNNAILTK
jgi:hypothetical protein